ncbi:unnamed protein product [Lactuca saligna]|uniref:Uncharacterized protein n=1 Tax=Lactuca saligna TaxID=75948 RepID=A0AA35YFD8_LACSI|nr:unnamed protein product [Lactuca saligna]CAI9272942.1 unnamed protein product [Lactuca saligna]CAI9285253.1 unnamed protein product [Lactuca saligna]
MSWFLGDEGVAIEGSGGQGRRLRRSRSLSQQLSGFPIASSNSDEAAPSNDWIVVAKGGWEREVAATGGREMGVAAEAKKGSPSFRVEGNGVGKGYGYIPYLISNI